MHNQPINHPQLCFNALNTLHINNYTRFATILKDNLGKLVPEKFVI